MFSLRLAGKVNSSKNRIEGGVCKTRTRYLQMADADGKMTIEKIVNNNKNKKETQIWIYKLCH